MVFPTRSSMFFEEIHCFREKNSVFLLIHILQTLFFEKQLTLTVSIVSMETERMIARNASFRWAIVSRNTLFNIVIYDYIFIVFCDP